MRFNDLIRLALANLRRNRGRSVLTLVGVTIGVAALLSLLSYGSGLQQNARREFNTLELYNTLRITTAPDPIDALSNVAGEPRTTWLDTTTAEAISITDSLLEALERIDGVLAAYPEVTFPVEVETDEREVVATADAVPMAFAEIPSYQPAHGAFFSSPADSAVLISISMARRLGFDPPESAVGQTIQLTTASLDLRALQFAARAFSQGLATLPIRKNRYPMRVAGLLKEEGQAFSGFVRIVVPLDVAKGMQKITFFSTLDLLLTRSAGTGYAAARVQLSDMDHYEEVRAEVERRGLYVSSLRDRFQQLERLFLMLDLALGIIGFIALLVATIGIANTMMMNVMERYREIGILKALGGEEGDLQRLFIAESLAIGLAGGMLGLLLGWGITALVNAAANSYLQPLGVPYLDLFYASPVMVAGILGVALLVSLLAGLAPARRAARIEPIKALRSA